MTRSATFLALSAAVLLAGALLLIGLRKSPANIAKIPDGSAPAADPATPAAETADGAAVSAVLAPTREAPPAASLATPPSEAPTALDEASLMTTLRDLRGSNPPLTLKLAREGNQRFPDSPDAAERSWVIVKSLSDLGRHDEARAEGRRLLERYRDTRWGEDVYRHLFVNPPTHPFERGYGKELELE